MGALASITPPLATSTCAKCRCTTRSRSVTSRPCLRCVEETILATCHPQDTIQVSTDDVSSAQSPVPWLYMSNTVSLVSDDPGRRRLRSATSTDYHVPRTRTRFGDRAFSIAGPKAWNNLPQSVRSDSLDSFKRKLKFHLFNSCFNVWTVFVCVLL